VISSPPCWQIMSHGFAPSIDKVKLNVDDDYFFGKPGLICIGGLCWD